VEGFFGTFLAKAIANKGVGRHAAYNEDGGEGVDIRHSQEGCGKRVGYTDLDSPGQIAAPCSLLSAGAAPGFPARKN
jgi:hypothetical protein